MHVLALLAVSASLQITVWPQGPDAAAKQVWTLRCVPAQGTLPQRAAACRRLALVQRPFAPVPRNAACTQIYGGPQTALVTGRLRGKRVYARFSRRDGCQVARWNRVRFLFPVSTSAR